MRHSLSFPHDNFGNVLRIVTLVVCAPAREHYRRTVVILVLLIILVGAYRVPLPADLPALPW